MGVRKEEVMQPMQICSLPQGGEAVSSHRPAGPCEADTRDRWGL